MPITVTPETHIPLPLDTTPEELVEFRDRAKTAVETIRALIEAGGEVEVNDEDRHTARKVLSGGTIKIKEDNAGALLHLEAILSEYDRELLNASTRLRTYVTNKLLLETADPDPKVRLRALELLGKTANVGAFSERLEVNVNHRTVDQIDSELEQFLEKYMGHVEEVKPQTADELQSLLEMGDEELGITDVVFEDKLDGELEDAGLEQDRADQST
jgi:succinate dehydrogenase flavin-adding protein (antitoxin of CptAB toxin-antitoxin module)